MNVAPPVKRMPIETRLDDDGVGYTWAEFEIELLT
jgi:hypothetical protein